MSPMMLKRDGHQPAPADPLDRSEGDQLGQVLTQPAQDRTGEEDQDRGLEDVAAAVEIGDLAPERRRRGGRQEVAGHHPGKLVEPTQLADDAGQGSADDALVERGEHHSRHQPEEHDDDLLVTEVLGFVLSRRRSRLGLGCSPGERAPCDLSDTCTCTCDPAP